MKPGQYLRSPEMRQKQSEIMKCIMRDSTIRQKLSEAAKQRRGEKNPMWGKHHSLEARQRMSKARIGKTAGAKHPFWKGGRYKQAGYIYIHKPDHPCADRHGYVPEHRLIAEEISGNLLKPEEIVHHINERRDDNRRENLIIFDNNTEHRKFHNLLEKELINDAIKRGILKDMIKKVIKIMKRP